MDKKTAWILGIIALIIVLLLMRQNRLNQAGDTTNTQEPQRETETTTEPESSGEETEEGEETAPAPTPSTGGLSLAAEALGDGKVKFSWTAPEGLNESNRFIIIRDEQSDPEHSGKNFWIRQHYSKREVIWPNNPTGTMHYRICLTANDQKDICTEYSNDVTLEVR